MSYDEGQSQRTGGSVAGGPFLSQLVFFEALPFGFGALFRLLDFGFLHRARCDGNEFFCLRVSKKLLQFFYRPVNIIFFCNPNGPFLIIVIFLEWSRCPDPSGNSKI